MTITIASGIIGLSAYALQVLAIVLLARLSARCFRLWWRLQRKNGGSIAAA